MSLQLTICIYRTFLTNYRKLKWLNIEKFDLQHNHLTPYYFSKAEECDLNQTVSP